MIEKERIRQRPDNENDNTPIDDADQPEGGSGKNTADVKKKLDEAAEKLKKVRKMAQEAAASDEKDDSEVKEQKQDAGQ
jgi:hypothetical protein